MSLPDLIEIVPLDQPVHAEITVPGSKSITNRALILAALAEGEVTLEGALWSEDTQIMVECLQELGFMVDVRPDPNEDCNRTITVYGKGGAIPPGGTEEQPMELFVGNAGTAARFLAAFVCLGKGVYRLHGVPRMHERPQAALFQALRELGYRVDSPNDKLPATIFCEDERERGSVSRSILNNETATNDSERDVPGEPAAGYRPALPLRRSCKVSIEQSSQFASALLLCANRGGWQVEIIGENAEESPYVAMTLKLIEVFPKRGGEFLIEPDASSGSYFWAAGWLSPNPILDRSDSVNERLQTILAKAATKPELQAELQNILAGASAYHAWWQQMPEVIRRGDEAEGQWLIELSRAHTVVGVKHWPRSRWQIDSEFPNVTRGADEISRKDQLGDSIMTAVICAPFEQFSVRFTDLGRLRVQECERVSALRTELTKCGAKVIEEGDTLTVYPSGLHGAEIETYNDHRMAMCFAILGLKVPGIKIKNPACVKKTFPNFFQKLATAPPNGLGATILDGTTGKVLTHEELFAD
ncbi:MAG: 3-phosphoshikimate 1-carboxyvinyltransferase [Akkermansiaceae bacterium]|nr:3-phosphoshikimate 1-carboxyvinyltransferase [Verrucomicrobiales bacterium]